MKLFHRLFLLFLLSSSAAFFPVAGASAADDRDACAMLRKADIEAAFVLRKFDSGTPGLTMKSSKSWAGVSECTYTSRGATIKDMITVTLGVRRAQNDETGITPEAAKAGAAILRGTPVDVSGLGQGAYWISLGSKTFPSIQLNVFKGKREWLTFGCRANNLDQDIQLERLKKIAKNTLARK